MRRTLHAVVAVVGGELLLRAANLLAVVVLARLYGAEVLGIYAVTLAAVTVAVMVADNGLQVSTIAEVGRSHQGSGGERSSREVNLAISQAHLLKTALFLIMVAFLALLAWSLAVSATVWMVGAAVAARTILYSYGQMHAAVAKALGRAPQFGMIQAAHFFVLSAGILLLYQRQLSLPALLAVLLAAQVLELILSSWLLLALGVRPARTGLRGCWGAMKRGAPVGAAYSLAALMVRADVIVVALAAPLVEVGQFAAVHAGLVVVYAAAWLLGGVFLADVARLPEGKPRRDYVARWSRLALAALLPLSLAVIGLAGPLVRAFYGADFAQAAGLLALLAPAIPLIVLNSLYLVHAIARGQVGGYLAVGGTTAVFSLAAGLTLAANFGGAGVAAVIVIRELVMLAGLHLLMRSAPRPEAAPHQEEEAAGLLRGAGGRAGYRFG